LKKIPIEKFDSDVLVQSLEENVYGEYALKHIKDYDQKYLKIPIETDKAYNMGTFGG
jgi:hypothetical protein